MTLSEIATLITNKLGRTDSGNANSSVDICKSFIKRRYKMIFDNTIWLETLGACYETVTATIPGITISSSPVVWYSPKATTVSGTAPKVDIPMAVRFEKTGEESGVEVTPSNWWTYFQTTPDKIMNYTSIRGTPENFIHLPKDADGYSRIQLVPSPDVGGSVFIMGKLAWAEPADDDSPIITGIDEALLAYAEGDMLERGRKYAKAQLKFQEASSLVSAMRQTQRQQFGSETLIIPDIYEESRDTLMFH